MKLIITIDTEEDNWGEYNLSRYSLENIKRIDRLQDLFDRFGVIPTYLVTYPVATDKRASSILKRIMREGRCEIGTHCHPWNTPPFEEERNARNSMLCNLPEDLQFKKIDTLHHEITRNFGKEPTSFRAGRWGFGESTARCLMRLSYKIDSSIIAFQNWDVYGGPDYSNVFPGAFSWEWKNEPVAAPYQELLEIPATAGYKQGNFALCEKLWKALDNQYAQKLHLKGILARLGALNKIWLSPETSNSSQMMMLTKTLMNEGYSTLNMFFHSTALKAGLSTFVKTQDDEARFLRSIEEYLVFARDAGIESITLSESSA